MSDTDASPPRILSIDIETFPILGYTWGAYEQNVIHIVRPTIVCCWSAKWLGGEQITRALPDYKRYKRDKFDDAPLVREMWELLSEAQIVVYQNGDKFDRKKLNTRFAHAGLTPPPPFQPVDTLKTFRSVFGFDVNRLDEVCAFFGIGRKLRHSGFEMWLRCMDGDPKAWVEMKKYNAHDVAPLLEEVYLRILPWIKNHPNIGLYTGTACCTRCGSSKLQARGFARTNACTYRRYQCQACGGWMRDAHNPFGTSDLRSA